MRGCHTLGERQVACAFRTLAVAVLVTLHVGMLASAVAAAQGRVPAYRIGPEDELRISVLELPELNVERRVDSAGTVRLPVIGDVPAAGKTPSELADAIERRLTSEFVRQASVDVEVIEYESRKVSVIGAVQKPGEYGFGAEWTLLEALTAAGGLDEGHGDALHILRTASNGLSDRLTLPVQPLTSGERPEFNLPLMPGDLINVERGESVEIFVLGEASQKGSMRFAAGDRVTLLFAIARMGGLPERASPKIVIRRRGPEGEMREIHVNFKRVLAGKDPDVELRDGDILIVKQSFF